MRIVMKMLNLTTEVFEMKSYQPGGLAKSFNVEVILIYEIMKDRYV